jgi:uncharacterized membrane protein YgcG
MPALASVGRETLEPGITMFKQKLLLLLVCVVVTFGMACSPATPAPSHSQKSGDSKVLSALASKETQEALGITRWHMIFQKGNNVVIDGADAKGRVRFSSLIHHDSHTLRIESYAERGTLTIDAKTEELGIYTLPGSWATHATAFSADWTKAHGKAAYSFLSNSAFYLSASSTVAYGVAGVAAGVGAIAAVVPGGQGVALGAAAVAAGALGVGKVLDGASKIATGLDAIANGPSAQAAASGAAAGNDPNAAAGADPNAAGNDPNASGSDPNAAGNDPNNSGNDPNNSGNDPNASGAGSDPSTSGSDPSTGSDPSSTGSDPSGGATSDSAGQPDSLPTGNADSNLDNSTGGDTGGGDTGGGDTGGGDTGGGDTGGGDTGGGEYGAHLTCRAVSCSKSLKACICKHY